MTTKFNPKTFLGKPRIYRPTPGTVNINRLWIWDADRGEYGTPERGKIYEARRYESNVTGGKVRVKRYFDTLDDARRWQAHLSDDTPDSPVVATAPTPDAPVNLGPTFAEVYERFCAKRVSKLSQGTRINYERYVRLHFQEVMPVPVRSITAGYIDSWLDKRMKTIGKTMQSRTRVNFDHELSVMRSVLTFYGEYYEDSEFRFPLKARHAEDAKVKKAPPKHKDLSLEEFERFLGELRKFKDGTLMASMATVQFYQALRISEAAALHWEDVNFNWKSPSESTLRVCKHVLYPRKAGQPPVIADGFKNARGGEDSIKELSLFRESFDALKALFHIGIRGLVFKSSTGALLTYRQIQAAYDDAFARADLRYRGTHVLRHAGCRYVYNQTGDLAIAMQHLGNSDMESTLVYAKRDKAAFRNFVQKDWEKEAGRNWSQIK